MSSSIRNVKFLKMSKLNMFITADCVLFLIKVRWPKVKVFKCVHSLLTKDLMKTSIFNFCRPRKLDDPTQQKLLSCIILI